MSTHYDYVFLHGGGQGSWTWQETITALQTQNSGSGTIGQIIALNIPGCGTKRDRDTQSISFQQIVDELHAELEAANANNIIFVGHSQAGNIMPALSQRNPSRFHRLVYVSCSIPLPGQTVIEMIGNSVHGSNDKEVGWPVDPAKYSMRERTEIMMCNDMSDADTKDFMAKLGKDSWPMASYSQTDWAYEAIGKVPATYVTCLQDNILPINWQKTFAQRFKTDREILIDAGHQVMSTRPQALAEILLQQADISN